MLWLKLVLHKTAFSAEPFWTVLPWWRSFQPISSEPFWTVLNRSGNPLTRVQGRTVQNRSALMTCLLPTFRAEPFRTVLRSTCCCINYKFDVTLSCYVYACLFMLSYVTSSYLHHIMLHHSCVSWAMFNLKLL